MESIALVAMIAFIVGLMVLAALHGRRLERALTAHLQSRGFQPLQDVPDLSLEDVRLEQPLAFRGRFAKGIVGVLSVGRCAGQFYVCASLPPHRSLDDEWLTRFRGRCRAQRRRDSEIVVIWRCLDTRTNVDDILAELESELVDAIR